MAGHAVSAGGIKPTNSSNKTNAVVLTLGVLVILVSILVGAQRQILAKLTALAPEPYMVRTHPLCNAPRSDITYGRNPIQVGIPRYTQLMAS